MDGFRKLVQHYTPHSPSLTHTLSLSTRPLHFVPTVLFLQVPVPPSMYTAVRSANCTCRSPRVEFAYRLPLILWTTRSIFHDATCTPNYGVQHHTVDRVLLRIPLLVPNRNPMIPLTKLRVTNKRDCLPEVLAPARASSELTPMNESI